jgi:hypothetical protein
MVDVTIEGSKAVFAMEASHKIWALKSRLEIPLEHITGAHVDPNPAMGWFDGLKVSGADIPHVFRAGTFVLHGALVFYDVRDPHQTIVVELAHEHFSKLIVEVAEPEATVEMLRTALAKHQPA